MPRAPSEATSRRLIRCAIYTRQSVNSSDDLSSCEVQHDVCRLYVESQSVHGGKMVIWVIRNALQTERRLHEPCHPHELIPRIVNPVAGPLEPVTQYPKRFVKYRLRNVDLDNPRASHAERPNRRAAKVQCRHIDVGIKCDSVHSAPVLLVAPFAHNLWHIGFDDSRYPSHVPRTSTTFEPIFHDHIPAPK